MQWRELAQRRRIDDHAPVCLITAESLMYGESVASHRLELGLVFRSRRFGIQCAAFRTRTSRIIILVHGEINSNGGDAVGLATIGAAAFIAVEDVANRREVVAAAAAASVRLLAVLGLGHLDEWLFRCRVNADLSLFEETW